jgi:hypothetical protein
VCPPTIETDERAVELGPDRFQVGSVGGGCGGGATAVAEPFGSTDGCAVATFSMPVQKLNAPSSDCRRTNLSALPIT